MVQQVYSLLIHNLRLLQHTCWALTLTKEKMVLCIKHFHHRIRLQPLSILGPLWPPGYLSPMATRQFLIVTNFKYICYRFEPTNIKLECADLTWTLLHC